MTVITLQIDQQRVTLPTGATDAEAERWAVITLQIDGELVAVPAGATDAEVERWP